MNFTHNTRSLKKHKLEKGIQIIFDLGSFIYYVSTCRGRGVKQLLIFSTKNNKEQPFQKA